MSIRSISSRGMLPLSLLPLLCGTASSALAQCPLSFAAAATYAAGTFPSSVAVGDFNADGDAGTDANIEAFFRVIAGGLCLAPGGQHGRATRRIR